MSISIEKISYQKKLDLRIMETVLSNWFKSPKELNWTDPRMDYPFSFKQWITLNYGDSDKKSYVIKSNDWIIGMGNMVYQNKKNRAHALHIFVDPDYRRQGLATKMIEFLEHKARRNGMEIITLRVMPKNEPAKQLYKNLGFQVQGTSRWGSLILEKALV